MWSKNQASEASPTRISFDKHSFVMAPAQRSAKEFKFRTSRWKANSRMPLARRTFRKAGAELGIAIMR